MSCCGRVESIKPPPFSNVLLPCSFAMLWCAMPRAGALGAAIYLSVAIVVHHHGALWGCSAVALLLLCLTAVIRA